MAKRREQRERMNMSAGAPVAAASSRPVEWWTQIAFVLAVALVLARATMGDFSKSHGEPMTADTPRAAGAATQLALDLLCCLPAILVLARRVSDREYVLRWSWAVLPLGLLAAWGVLSMGWGGSVRGADGRVSPGGGDGDVVGGVAARAELAEASRGGGNH